MEVWVYLQSNVPRSTCSSSLESSCHPLVTHPEPEKQEFPQINVFQCDQNALAIYSSENCQNWSFDVYVFAFEKIIYVLWRTTVATNLGIFTKMLMTFSSEHLVTLNVSTSLLTFPYFWGDPIIFNGVLLPHLQTTIFSYIKQKVYECMYVCICFGINKVLDVKTIKSLLEEVFLNKSFAQSW